MSKKYSFSEFSEFQGKVKKEKPKKDAPQVSEAAQDKRHEKINFKQYLRGLKETQGVDDEFVDIPLLTASDLVRSLNERTVVFGQAEEDQDDNSLQLAEQDWDSIKNLERDDSITIVDSYDDRWYVSRSLNNQIVFESQEYCLSGKYDFDEFIKKLK